MSKYFISNVSPEEARLIMELNDYFSKNLSSY